MTQNVQAEIVPSNNPLLGHEIFVTSLTDAENSQQRYVSVECSCGWPSHNDGGFYDGLDGVPPDSRAFSDWIQHYRSSQLRS